MVHGVRARIEEPARLSGEQVNDALIAIFHDVAETHRRRQRHQTMGQNPPERSSPPS